MNSNPRLTSVELFSGAGGLALGIAAAGFQHRLLLEYNKHACQTLRQNHIAFGGEECEIFEGDVRRYDFAPLAGTDLLAAGAPCQPFSIAGKHRADQDERNLFPQVFRAQREIQPRAVIIENVKGLLRDSLSEFVEYIELQLANPMVLAADPLDPEGWQAHLPSLRAADRRDAGVRLRYTVSKVLLNAADFGVPQRRERVFFVAIREDIGAEWTPPAPTHSQAALQLATAVTGAYWAKHGITRKVNPRHLLAGKWMREAGKSLPWATVRDAIADLPRPSTGRETPSVANHVSQPGAKSYPGHTGSPLDSPAKTLKAGVHGVPGGENMLRNPNGSVRYFTVREAARIQGFPDSYVFKGAWGEAMRQIGNAVPIRLAEVVAESVRACLSEAEARDYVPLRAVVRPRPTRRAPEQQELLLPAHSVAV